MIQVADFSDNTAAKFNQAKESKSFTQAFDFVQCLINNDYPIDEVKAFAKKEFKAHYKFLCFEVLN